MFGEVGKPLLHEDDAERTQHSAREPPVPPAPSVDAAMPPATTMTMISAERCQERKAGETNSVRLARSAPDRPAKAPAIT